MTTTSPIVGTAEGHVRDLATQFLRPREHECLCCYVIRLTNEFPCDGTHRHALRYRDLMAPRATALLTRLERVGACCCDCELFLNGYWLRSWVQQCKEYGEIIDDHGEAGFVNLPACQGVRRGSVRPCGNWVRVVRPWRRPDHLADGAETKPAASEDAAGNRGLSADDHPWV